MTSLVEFLFPAPARRSPGAILAWWEKRRLAYNVAVGVAGTVGLAIGSIFALLPPGGLGRLALPPWEGIVIIGLVANVCYLLGPATEILVEKVWGRQVLPTGPALYRMGLTFSVGLGLLPALMMVIVWVVRLVTLPF